MDKYERQHHYEKQFIGMILKKPAYWEDKQVQVHHFESYKNKELFNVLHKLFMEKKSIERSTFATLQESTLQKIGGLAHIDECMELATNTKYDAFKQIEKEMQTFYIGKTLLAKIKPLEQAEIFDLEECRLVAQEVNNTINDVKQERKNFFEMVLETNNKLMNMSKGMSGIPTGYPTLDAFFDGWQQNDLILVGARPSMGKTALTINFMLHSAMKGAEVIYIPAETGEESIIKRAIAILGGLPVNGMRNPKEFFSEYQLNQMQNVVKNLTRLPIHIEELHDIGDIKQLIREKRKEYQDKKILVIIDHLGHISNSKMYQSRNLEYEDYCKELKNMSKEYNVATMLLSQLSRGVEQRQDKHPMLSDLRDSGSIEALADLIIFLYRENYYLKDEEKSVEDYIELNVAKNRDGATGTCKLRFLPSTNRVIEE